VSDRAEAFGGPAPALIRERVLPAVDEMLFSSAPEAQDARATIIKENPVRQIVRVDVGGRVGAVFVKRFKCRHWRDALKSVAVGPRSAKEWRMAHRLLAAGIPTAIPLAIGRSARAARPRSAEPRGDHAGGSWASWETYLVTQEIADAASLRQWAMASPDRLTPQTRAPKRGDLPGLSPALRRAVIVEAGRFLARFHLARFSHRDTHAENILARIGNGRPPEVHLFMLDLHSLLLRWRLGRRHRERNMAFLMKSLRFCPVTTADRIRFLRSYLATMRGCAEDGVSGHALRVWTRGVTKRAAQVRRDYWRGRTRRCLLNSSRFTVERTDLGRVHRLREYSPGQLERAIQSHREALGRGEFLKRSPETNVTRVPAPGGEGPRLCVKEFCSRGLGHRLKDWLRPSPARRSWVASQALTVREIPTPRAVALVEPRRGLLRALVSPRDNSHYLITEDAGEAEPMNRYVRRRFSGAAGRRAFADKVAFLHCVADFLHALHAHGAYHHDLKSSNVLVRERAAPAGGVSWEIALVDLAAVTFHRRLSDSKRIKNLAQLNASLPKAISWADRIRFLRDYARGPLRFKRKRAAVREIIRRTLARSCTWERKGDRETHEKR